MDLGNSLLSNALVESQIAGLSCTPGIGGTKLVEPVQISRFSASYCSSPQAMITCSSVRLTTVAAPITTVQCSLLSFCLIPATSLRTTLVLR